MLYNGDCLNVLRTLDDNSIDSIVTDPPYGLAFMGKRWDYDVPSVEVWAECLRVLKPGGHLLAFAGTRTQHRMCVRIEDAGFDIRDMIAWVYGSGFPKSHNVSCAIDKAHGHPNRGRAIPTASTYQASDIEQKNKLTSNPVEAYDAKTDAARQWQGWGTALKPALEPITVARKPLDGTVAHNVTTWGTGAINVDGCRVEFASHEDMKTMENARWTVRTGVTDEYKGTGGMMTSNVDGQVLLGSDHINKKGRWPANLIHDGSDEVLGLFPSDEGRFFYCAKASKRDRDEGLTLPPRQYSHDGRSKPIENAYQRNESTARNNHPTVKPTDLMRYLCRLVTPPGGIVLDPFMGSGSTGKAAALEGFRFVGIERDPAYMEIARQRIAAVSPEPSEDKPASSAPPAKTKDQLSLFP
jgi:site-specific DNA-methyltransferase (adenine-specific)